MSLPYLRQARNVAATAATARYYTMPLGVISAGVAQTTGKQFWIPVRFDNKCIVNKIGVRATSTVSGSVSRVGIYKDAGLFHPRPGDLIGEASATLNTAAAAYVEGTLTAANGAVTKPGLYWLSIVTQTAAGTLDSASAIDSGIPLDFGTTAPAAVGTVGAYSVLLVTGALASVANTTALTANTVWPWLYYSVYNA